MFAAHVHTASRRWQVTVETLKLREKELAKVIPELEAKEQSPAATDDDRRALRSARATRSLTQGQLAHLRGEYWIGVLEEYGLLPNYTLLDDTVTLDVGISWTDPDSNDFRNDHAQFQRGSAQAIREFAPGATFYARGWEIAIDAIDLASTASPSAPGRSALPAASPSTPRPPAKSGRSRRAHGAAAPGSRTPDSGWTWSSSRTSRPRSDGTRR